MVTMHAGMRVLDNEYKLKQNIRIAMLYLEDDDAVNAEAYIKKASSLIASSKASPSEHNASMTIVGMIGQYIQSTCALEARPSSSMLMVMHRHCKFMMLLVSTADAGPSTGAMMLPASEGMVSFCSDAND